MNSMLLLTCAQAILVSNRVFDNPHLSSAQTMEIVEEIRLVTEPGCDYFFWDAATAEGT